MPECEEDEELVEVPCEEIEEEPEQQSEGESEQKEEAGEGEAEEEITGLAITGMVTKDCKCYVCAKKKSCDDTFGKGNWQPCPKGSSQEGTSNCCSKEKDICCNENYFSVKHNIAG